MDIPYLEWFYYIILLCYLQFPHKRKKRFLPGIGEHSPETEREAFWRI